MKKNPKQIAAIIALVLIAALIISFVVSAVTASEDSGNGFFICFFAIIAIPILAWLFIFCYGRLTGKHTIAELFPKEWQTTNSELSKNPDNADFTEEEISEAMENAKNDSTSK